MDIIFECPTCKQELSIDAEGAGSQIDCPACNTKVTVPNPDEELVAAPAPAPIAGKPGTPPPPAASDKPTPSAVINPMSTSAAAKESKHFSVPVHAGPTESLIAKPLPTLEVAAKETDRQMRIKSFRHSDHVEVGKDHFDEHLNQWLGKVGEQNIIKISTFSYTHQDLASRAWVTDYGVMVVYRG